MNLFLNLSSECHPKLFFCHLRKPHDRCLMLVNNCTCSVFTMGYGMSLYKLAKCSITKYCIKTIGIHCLKRYGTLTRACFGQLYYEFHTLRVSQSGSLSIVRLNNLVNPVIRKDHKHFRLCQANIKVTVS